MHGKNSIFKIFKDSKDNLEIILSYLLEKVFLKVSNKILI